MCWTAPISPSGNESEANRWERGVQRLKQHGELAHRNWPRSQAQRPAPAERHTKASARGEPQTPPSEKKRAEAHARPARTPVRHHTHARRARTPAQHHAHASATPKASSTQQATGKKTQEKKRRRHNATRERNPARTPAGRTHARPNPGTRTKGMTDAAPVLRSCWYAGLGSLFLCRETRIGRQG